MSDTKKGSVLVFALVAVTVLSILAIGLATWLRPKLALSTQDNTNRLEVQRCLAAIEAFAEEILITDTNGYDSVSETWREPYTSETIPEVTIQSEYAPLTDKEPQGAIDEESKLPLNLDITGPLEELITLVTDSPRELSSAIAKEINSLRPIICTEQILMAPSLTKDIYRQIVPYITALPIQGINLNTASDVVLKALFSEAKKYDAKASLTLSAKILAYRESGQALTSNDTSYLNSELNGLTQAEILLLGAAKEKTLVESRYISGKATSKQVVIYFTYDRVDKTLTRLISAKQ